MKYDDDVPLDLSVSFIPAIEKKNLNEKNTIKNLQSFHYRLTDYSIVMAVVVVVMVMIFLDMQARSAYRMLLCAHVLRSCINYEAYSMAFFTHTHILIFFASDTRIL